MSESDDETISFPDLRYSDKSLNQIWDGIKDIYSNQDRVYNQKIVENADKLPEVYPEETLRKQVLSKLRDALEEKDIIDIDHERGGREGTGGAPRKIWVFKDHKRGSQGEEGDQQ
ncbi:hypothetical protein [Natrinema salinisoli]|uniref:hypothetical protein n=1 Tax=Natrinema salinisoli TaxID=2878535 RepID=UPI001CEFE845|nr:hypothetical protein [Natrinema salinisoli]